jgi:Zn-dependent protease with chaperone function
MPSILGPEDRESFFEVQARDRRASWKLAAASIFGVLLMASALVLTLAPPLVAVVIVIADGLNLFVPGTPNVFEMLMGSAPLPTPLGTWLGPALILLPGTVLALASWTIVSRLTFRSEVASLLLREAAREPRTGDLEEQQLGNVVAEMAIAAGIQPPNLRLVDAPAMNAVALGSGVNGTTIVVTRGLLDALDREETQAIIGHLIASVGNGDLRIAHYILTMYATVGLLERLPFTPLDPGMRVRVRMVVRSARAGDTTSDEDLGALALELYRSPGEDGGSIVQSDLFDLMKRPRAPKITWVERLPKPLAQGIAWPLFYVTMAQSMCRLTLLGLFVNPLLALLWRRRRLLADASAVQLCRDPTALARALAKLSNQALTPPGDPILAFLFPASPARGGLQSAAGNFGGPKAIFPAPSLPSPNDRAARLHRMGAHGAATTRHRAGPMYALQLAGRGILALLAVALWAFCFTMGCVVLGMSIFVGAPLAFFLLLLGPHVLLRGIIPWLLGR